MRRFFGKSVDRLKALEEELEERERLFREKDSDNKSLLSTVEQLRHERDNAILHFKNCMLERDEWKCRAEYAEKRFRQESERRKRTTAKKRNQAAALRRIEERRNRRARNNDATTGEAEAAITH